MQHTGYLRHLLLRRGVTSGEILVHVITTSQAEYDYAPLVSRLLALPLEGKIVGIMHIINDSLSLDVGAFCSLNYRKNIDSRYAEYYVNIIICY